jgi:diguanylate cyclase (GGDEF)-like protein
MARKTLNSLKVRSIGRMKAAPLGAEAARASIDRLRRKNATLRRTLARLLAFRAMAYRDPLTGLRNRRYFDERLAEEVERAHRNFGGGPSVIAIDINSFKQINDLEGHRAGDEVLKWVAAFLESTTRSYDICCRTGGDEFMAILPATGEDGCARLIQRLREKLSRTNRKLGRALGLSIGSASWSGAGTTVEALVAAADAAMYLDKRRQKARRRLSAVPRADRVGAAST